MTTHTGTSETEGMSPSATTESLPPWRLAWQRLRRNRAAAGALVFLGMIAFACVFAPLVLPWDYATQNRVLGPVPPCTAHWLGTDTLGRDLLVRCLQGGQISLQIALIATVVSTFIGIAYGLTAGWVGGRTEMFMIHAVDVLCALPFTLLVILLTVIFGQDLFWIYMAVGAVSWLSMARIVRAQTCSLKTRPFVEAALCLGQTPRRILMRHLLPNLAGVIVVHATLTAPAVMLTEAFMSFLGLGVRAPMTSWGLLIKEGADVMEEFPWLLIFPSLAFSATLFALNFLGDGLRDALDPRAGNA
ncbi:MAG: ABC transporter permease [Puniceicoccales bacterium]|jgi:oligopeptide transport system permease protein|nr:ABC transporter permease [Puniceicoccales bacterium]